MRSDRFSRQSFLGDRAQAAIENARVGITGLGGGGSHIAQQLAHLGFRQFVLYDPDVVEESNLNRLVGATQHDARKRRSKLSVAQRLIHGLQASAEVLLIERRWQDEPRPLRGCDLIFGCVDSLQERSELEVCARRFLVPYLDIGLGVKAVSPEPPRMAGQVILSMPGAPCFRCLGFLSERDLAEEAGRYGDAGARPQVVWANGVLAATAVGVAVDLLTDWTKALRHPVYLTYDGNRNTVTPHPRLGYLRDGACPHFPPDDVGEPSYVQL